MSAAKINRSEFCRRFVEYMTREAGFETFDNGLSVRSYADGMAEEYFENLYGNSPEEAAQADMDCWEDTE